SLIESIEGSSNLLWGGIAIFCLCMTGCLAAVVLRDISAWTAMLAGCAALFVGAGVTAAAIAADAGALFLVAPPAAGVGFGLAFLGNFRAISGVTPLTKRAGTLATMYIFSYSAFSIPIVVAGIAQEYFSAHTVALVFSIGVAALGGIGIVASLPSFQR